MRNAGFKSDLVDWLLRVQHQVDDRFLRGVGVPHHGFG